MKIIQLITRRQLRGAEVFALQLAQGLRQRGEDASLVALYGPADPPLSASGVQVIDISGGDDSGLRVARLRRLAGVLRRSQPDVVQANGSDTLKYSVLSKRLFRLPFPIVYRNIGMASDWLRGPVHRATNRWLLAGTDHIAAVSEATRIDLAACHSLDECRLTTIPVGTVVPARVDRPRARRLLAEAAPVSSAAHVVVNVGSLTPEKNPRGLLRAFGRVAEAGLNVHLVLIGDGPLRADLQGVAAQPPLAGRVHFLGARQDVAELLPAADVFVSFSHTEGLPGVLLEAGAHGIAAVAADVGAVSEVVVDGRTGLLVGPGDEAALARGICRLLTDHSLRTAMGEMARNHVRERYDLEVVVDTFIALYRRIGRRAA